MLINYSGNIVMNDFDTTKAFYSHLQRNIISKSISGDHGAVLTTHSMEEADALCTRVAILVKGKLR